MDLEIITSSFPLLLAGAGVTIEITALSVGFGMAIGIVISLIRMTGIRLLRILGNVYVDFLRGTPLLVQIFLVYFALPALIHHQVDAFFAAVFACSINSGAYVAEIFRGGIESMPVGQYEAAKILGYNKVQTFFRIILPQVIKRILPSITNEVITLVKDTSLAFVVAVAEMFTIAKQIASAQTTMMPFVIAAIFYYVFNLIVAVVMQKVEKSMNYYR